MRHEMLTKMKKGKRSKILLTYWKRLKYTLPPTFCSEIIKFKPFFHLVILKYLPPKFNSTELFY